jgi:hypothetical protein
MPSRAFVKPVNSAARFGTIVTAVIALLPAFFL